MMSIRIVESAEPLRDPAVQGLQSVLQGGNLTSESPDLKVSTAVRDIIAQVGHGGDAALIELEQRLDGAVLTPESLRVPVSLLEAAHAAAEPAFLALIRRVRANIAEYQESILWPDPPPVKRGGRMLGVRYTPVDRAGVYVPGGKALYPSTVLMTIVPAQVAGVREVALASPPRTNGDVHPMVLALAHELGITEVYRLGGAPAIAAMALGTAHVKRVDKVVGPGNAFVAEAKRQLFGQVGIDSIAGPSEVLILADDSARPDWIAADLLAQAEHDPGSGILVTTSRVLAEQVAASVAALLPQLERAAALRSALERYSMIVVVPDLGVACDVANAFATEHLEIVTREDEAVLARIRNAGAIFIGAETPVPVGDYYAGPSHVLPTGGTARFFGPLNANDFRKASSLVRYDAASIREDGPDIVDFAGREGLTAHALAVSLRSAD